jgi:hypothetical protein
MVATAYRKAIAVSQKINNLLKEQLIVDPYATMGGIRRALRPAAY